ncbi:MarR family winged helix-turn-helix transcriptional regulator [Salinarimonas soli]|uniref:MarR family transcriptional regulator n=1 Tax=Salinarimonas soli TaxID=1638099 RepID=A0A5B2W027_9HYPH|nr:MarR family transcriptional regulator [Salinarimonas soli]KAA2244318.1 MarR family transcriptional regulator [Salinarimonas soli]
MSDPFASLRLDRQLCFSVYTAAQAFNAAYKPLLDGLGLTYPQYLVMMVLWEEDDLTVSGIGERLSLDSGTLTPLLKRLEAAGFVSRRRDTHDERLVRVTLTEKGRQTRSDAVTVPETMICALGQSLPDLQALKAAVDRITATLRGAEPRQS